MHFERVNTLKVVPFIIDLDCFKKLSQLKLLFTLNLQAYVARIHKKTDQLVFFPQIQSQLNQPDHRNYRG